MAGRDIIVVGASAGGIQALEDLVSGLPADLPAALFVVVHTSPSGGAVLPSILDRYGPLPAEAAVEGQPIQHGRIYVAAANQHLLVRPGSVCVTRGPKENGFRPAVDPLFRTAAKSYRGQVVGIVLSGGMDDGTAGLTDIKENGGIAIVQDPAEATFPSMPTSALENVAVDYVRRAADMPNVIVRLAREPLPEGVPGMAKPDEIEPDIAEIGSAGLRTHTMPGPPSGFVCPECGGALWELSGGKLLRFRCHNGHGYTAESLLAEQNGDLENALWTALRALEENADLRRRMARRAAERNMSLIFETYQEQAREAEERAGVIRRILVGKPQDVERMPKSKPTAANRDKGADRPTKRARPGSRAPGAKVIAGGSNGGGKRRGRQP